VGISFPEDGKTPWSLGDSLTGIEGVEIVDTI
jgi:hypothetical protein